MPESMNSGTGQTPSWSNQKTSSTSVPPLETPASKSAVELNKKASLAPVHLLRTSNCKQGYDPKIEAWKEEKQQIITKYTASKWTHARSVQQFLDMMAWCARWPVRGILDRADVPWPILKKPEFIAPEDMNNAEIEYFLENLRAITKDEFPACLKEMRIRFHLDKWSACWERIADVEERGEWKRAMLMLSQVISSYYDMYMKLEGERSWS